MVGTIQLTTLISLGFILGLKHTFDPDHIIAISAIVSQTKNIKKSLLQGVLWGIGHTITLLLVGSLILFFKIAIPQKLTLAFELLVGAVLIILGVNVLQKLVKDRMHLHKHIHDKRFPAGSRTDNENTTIADTFSKGFDLIIVWDNRKFQRVGKGLCFSDREVRG